MRSDTRRRTKATVAVVVGIGVFAVLGAARMRSASSMSYATWQDSEWGQHYVGSYHIRSSAPLFPSPARHGWRARTGRDPITGKLRK